jgi:hypothetical protein
MDPTAPQSQLRRPTGLRGGIVIGLALALVGIGVGTAAGAVTPFQLVVIKNTAAEPVPVTGTINVGNTPANQSVTVSNFPATQAVSGTVNVGNLPVVTKKFYQAVTLDEAFEYVTVPFGQTINVSSLHVVDGTGDNYNVAIDNLPLVEDTESNYSVDFTVPVPATGVQVTCLNLTLDCHLEIVVFGY